ncbi:BTAD domain-containing putative transcriptional regulator [Actinoplanes sp. NPDC024001]|uniref:AfsR/SARP family transcriptional regulator n=1 Tax=Actinoplanes sp. NPDC024001 TaxID=3154598 RepID=UPI0033E07543
MTDGSSPVALRFEILGPVRAYRGAEPVDLGPVKQQALLALLLLRAGEPVPMPDILRALWGGDPPENGVDAVQRYIGGLRRALEPSLLALTPGGYVLRSGENIDAGAFRAGVARARAEHQTGNLNAAGDEVRRALSLWGDEPLAGLTGAVFQSARARLNAERAAAAALLSEPTPPAPRSPASPPAPQSPAAPPAQAAPVAPKPARPEPDSGYAEPVDPWAGHELFPPGPHPII